MSNRAEVIQATIREIQVLEAKRHEIGAQIRAIKQTKVKADLGMKIGDFNAALRLASLEDEARDSFLDTLKETFAALGVGGQLSFLDPVPEETKPKRGRPPKGTDALAARRAEGEAAVERQGAEFDAGAKGAYIETDPAKVIGQLAGEAPPDPADDWPEVA